jgi:hypothetical protein
MRLLVDTNIILEIILEQEKVKEAQALLAHTTRHEFFITDYSLHSIGLILFHRKKHRVYRDFINDMIDHAGMAVIQLTIEDIESIIKPAQKYDLDFDDAYQYAAAEKYDLCIVSFDTDFDRTDRRRQTPADIVKG